MPTEIRIDCPALHKRSNSYPFGDRVPRTVRMVKSVTADPMPGIGLAYIKDGVPLATQNKIYDAWTNSHGAVAAVMPDGRHLGLRPGEFEVYTWHDLSPSPCKHEWTDDGAHLLVCSACGAQEDHDPGWLVMATAPTDGTMVRLLVEFEEHSTEDAEQAPTIGANNFDNDGEDVWRFAGWCWSHDHFTEGKGTPVGWLPMFDGPKLSACAEQPAPVAMVLHDRSPESYAIEHAEYMAKSADNVLAKFQAYGLALLAVDEGGDDGEGELFENIDSARGDLQESLVDLRSMVYEFRKRAAKSR